MLLRGIQAGGEHIKCCELKLFLLCLHCCIIQDRNTLLPCADVSFPAYRCSLTMNSRYTRGGGGHHR